MESDDHLEQCWFPDVDPYDGASDFIPHWDLAGVAAALCLAKTLWLQGVSVRFDRFDVPPSGVVE